MSDANKNSEEVVKNVENDLRNLLDWFKANCLLANCDKFQCIDFGKLAANISFTINVQILSPRF